MTGPDLAARRIGAEGNAVATVDGFHPDPDALRAAAIAARFEPARRHYPGVRAALPDDYFARVGPALATVLAQVFGSARPPRLLDASFSVVTTPPAALTLEQRLPHVDATEPGRIALVHYLMPAGGDGTAFYRHRATGFERVDDARAPLFYPRLQAEVRAVPPDAAYLTGASPLFERTHEVAGAYNRAVIYPSTLLHSGAIAPDSTLDADPATGRLTITAFLSIA